jgi:hypothetical protein
MLGPLLLTSLGAGIAHALYFVAAMVAGTWLAGAADLARQRRAA